MGSAEQARTLFPGARQQCSCRGGPSGLGTEWYYPVLNKEGRLPAAPRVQVEYVRNEKGEVLKRTTKTRVIKIEKKVYKVGASVVAAGFFCGGNGNGKCRRASRLPALQV